MYPAPRRSSAEPRARDATLETVPTAEGTVFALYARAPAGAPTLVWFHGNGEDLNDMPYLVHEFAGAGVGFYAVEYPGYGPMSDRATNEAAVYAAASAAIDHLQQQLGVPVSQTVLVGHSLGSGVAAEMARRGRGGRLVLIAPYTSMVDMARKLAPFLPASLLVRDRYDTQAKARELALPALVIHGSDDEMIPVAMGRRIAELLPRATLVVVPGARHNDLFATDPDLVRRIALFAGGG
jgi:pimeloyl-ACP methyl ester carboxylesterase